MCSHCYLSLSPVSPVPITLAIHHLYSTGLFVCLFCNSFWRIRTSLGSVPPSFSATSMFRQAAFDSIDGRKRLHALNLELIHHHPLIETRTFPHSQPLPSGPPDPKSRPPPSNLTQQSHAQSAPLRQSSLPVSALDKRPIPVCSNVDSNKKQKTQSNASSLSIRSLHGLALNIRGVTPEKWDSIQDLDIFPSLDFIILTEHQLSAKFRPDEIIRSGRDFHAVSGAITNLPRKGYRGQCHRVGLALLTRNSKHVSCKMTSLSGTVNKITGDKCKCMDKRRGSQGHGSRSLPILHQAVTWSLTSPLYNDTIHLTGVYIFPDENQL